MKKSTRTAITTATALNEYIDEITITDAEIAMEMAEIEAREMEMAKAMDEALAAIIDAQYWENEVNEALTAARKSNDPRAWEVYNLLTTRLYIARALAMDLMSSISS